MGKATIESVDLKGQRVLMRQALLRTAHPLTTHTRSPSMLSPCCRFLRRVDFNVPFDKKGNITNNQR
jgi:hypothetical protein